MAIDSVIIRYVEYCMCENAMNLYPKIKNYSSTFSQFCNRIRDSIISGELRERDVMVINHMIDCAMKEYRLKDEDLTNICTNFFIDRRWSRYIRAIELTNIFLIK